MIGAGLGWRTSLLAVFLGNAIVLVPMVINAHAGTRYGIPFPVFARAAFGTRGTHVPSLLRAVVACGWFGIQTWVGGLAIHALVGVAWPGFLALGGDWRFMGHTVAEFVSFAVFWVINLYFVWAGTESIKWLETVSAPFLHRAAAWRCCGGAPRPQAAWARCSRARIGAAPGSAGAATFADVPALGHRDGRLLGHALAQHPRLHPLRP